MLDELIKTFDNFMLHYVNSLVAFLGLYFLGVFGSPKIVGKR